MKEIKQREIYMCNLSGIDTEYQGIHPCLVLSVDIANQNNTKVIIVPITHQDKKRQPTHYYLYKSKYNYLLYEKNTVLCEEIQKVSNRRLQNKLGQISWNDLYYILDRLKYNFEPYCNNFNK